MYKVILLGLLLATSNSAMANWVSIGENDSFVMYVDNATIRKSGNIAKMWHMQDFKVVQDASGAKFLSLKMQGEYDCQAEKSRHLAFTFFSGNMGGGKVVFRNGNVKEERQPIEPDSVNEDLWNVACAKK